MENTDKVYTWSELASHNSESKGVWVAVSNKVYDITSWLEQHPGGKEMLLLCAGRDCTDIFTCYHPFTDKPAQIIKKFQIGSISDSEFPVYQPDSGFYKEVRQRVGNHFKEKNINPKDPIPGLWRMTLVFITAFLAFYCMCQPQEHYSITLIFAAIVFGWCQALPLLHIMHDSSHTAIGNTQKWWQICGQGAMDWFAGASMLSWHNQHVIGHHIYTNVMGADPDLPVTETGDARRIVKRQMWSSLYKYQYLYLPPLYGVLGLKFRIQDIFGTFIANTNGPIRVNPIPKDVVQRQIFTKLFWVFWRILVPLYIIGVPSSAYWTLFFIAEFTTGYALAFNFQVSHVAGELDFPNGENVENSINDEWAISQVKTSLDYAHGNWFATFFSGALNYQTTHHLFPSVSQYHYPTIAPIVKEVCKEYNIKYNHMDTFTEAFSAHIGHLKNMGTKGEAAHIH